ncbi:MAG: terminase large subunit domain-containing protein [Dyella sp.]|uniref:phage terminase large subunit family protein n=1 Tax=Dyella sp. TaxID=1869338 RepID=UPI003F7F81A0
MSASADSYFLPYQQAWLADQSRLKIVEKSRRVGLTYVQSYEDVRDAARREQPLDVWFSSADESAAKEYILYCAQWARIFKIAATELGETIISRDDDIKALTIQFANGRRINALTSNPKAFRSKGGKLVLDEFAFHGDQEAMWKAARPIITWGYPARVLSTYNGKGNRYYRMVADAKKAIAEGKKPLWSLHTITIERAVAEGLADRIMGCRLTAAERQKWLDDERESCGDEDTWQQEYMCNPVDEASAWLAWEQIVACESDEAGKPDLYTGGDCYIGWDVARTSDKSVQWVDEKVGDVMVTREVVTMRKKSFAEQLASFDRLMEHYNARRACIDKTGLGMPIVEEAQARWGEYRVEGVTFTGETKQHLATHGKQQFEDKRVRIPVSRDIRDSHHAVRKLTTAAGNARFDADRNEAGHADEFWAHMLALHAAEGSSAPAAGADVEATADTYRASGFGRRGGPGMFGKRATR